MRIPQQSSPALICTIVLAALMLGACSTAPGSGKDTKDTETVRAQPAWPEWTRTDCIPLSQLDRQPRLRRHTSPIIQAQWFPDGLQTSVTFLLEITPQGELGRVLWKPVDTDPRVIKAIQKSLVRWRFEPGMRQGQPVTSCYEQPYELIFPRINAPQTEIP